MTDSHPLLQLQGNTIVSGSDKVSVGRLTSNNSSSSSRSSSVAALDPLSIAFDGIDPLSQFAIESERDRDTAQAAGKSEPFEPDGQRHKSKREMPGLSQMESWSSRRAAILNKYTTTERLSIVTSFLTGGETSKLSFGFIYLSKPFVTI